MSYASGESIASLSLGSEIIVTTMMMAMVVLFVVIIIHFIQ